jgi:FMN phosphatase YigB (HAD superfamily)
MSGPLVVLDIGSTLVGGPPVGPASRIAIAANLDRHHKRALHKLLMTADCGTAADVYAAVSTDLGLTDRVIETAIAEVWSAQEDEARLLPGTLEALQGLVAHGCRLALLSNIWAPYFRSVQRLLGPFFAEHVSAELQLLSFREGLAKPAPELFSRLLDRAGTEPSQSIMVGDSYGKDIEPAISCGMHTLWVLSDPAHETAALLRVLNGSAAGPTAAVKSLADIEWTGLPFRLFHPSEDVSQGSSPDGYEISEKQCISCQ